MAKIRFFLKLPNLQHSKCERMSQVFGLDSKSEYGIVAFDLGIDFTQTSFVYDTLELRPFHFRTVCSKNYILRDDNTIST